MPSPTASPAIAPADTSRVPTMVWRVLLATWVLVLCFVPDPRPLGAPEWAVGAVRAVSGLGEPSGRVVSTLIMRVGGLALLGALLMLALGTRRWSWRSTLAVLLAPALAIGTLWVNYGYFPIRLQIQIASVSAIS